tara:strand:- start:376 stop:639 length:264 start_codon:yes stop_codon:yes gene_type:complete
MTDIDQFMKADLFRIITQFEMRMADYMRSVVTKTTTEISLLLKPWLTDEAEEQERLREKAAFDIFNRIDDDGNYHSFSPSMHHARLT